MQHRGARRIRPEPRHGLLERPRAAVLVEGEGLAVEDHIAHRQSAHHLHHLGQPVGHLGQGARVDAHVVADAVHLDAGAVELVFHGRLPRGLQRRAGAGRGCGEHGLHGTADDEADGVKLGRRARDRQQGGPAEVAGEHRRAAYGVDGPVRGAGNGIRQHPLKRTGSQFPEQHAGDEGLLAFGGCRRERPEGRGALRRRSGACGGEQPVQRGVEVGDGKARLGGRLPHGR